MFDRRVDDFRSISAYIFDATFMDGLQIEVQINAEFESPDVAARHADKYARAVGQLPTFLRLDVKTMWIHKGYFVYGGGNDNILIHVDWAEEDDQLGFLEEALIHEGVHASLDAHHKDMRAWRAAQRADNRFISEYARDYPQREDLAESFVLYLALEYLPGRLPADIENVARRTIPNRIEYLDRQDFGRACPIIPEDCRKSADQGEWMELKRLRPTVLRHHRSTSSSTETAIRFVNSTEADISFHWVDFNGKLVEYGVIPPEDSARQHTFEGHLWAIKDASGEVVAVFRAEREFGRALVGGATE